MNNTILFQFEGIDYTVKVEKLVEDLEVQLPDGRVLKLSNWIETNPPAARNATEIKFPKAKNVK